MIKESKETISIVNKSLEKALTDGRVNKVSNEEIKMSYKISTYTLKPRNGIWTVTHINTYGRGRFYNVPVTSEMVLITVQELTY